MNIKDLKGISSIIKVYIPVEPKNSYTGILGGLFSDLFGGATLEMVKGFWKSDTLGLIVEDMQILYSFANIQDIEKNLDVILHMVEEMKASTSQEAISMEINGNLYFI